MKTESRIISSIMFVMKRNLSFLIVLAILVSCGQPRSNNSMTNWWEEDTEAINAAKEKRQKQYADSTVHLSFNGIKLGEPFRKTIAAAKKEEKIRNIKIENTNGTAATCIANLFLPDREQPIEVDVKVASHQDTITSFVIMSTDYETKEAIKLLYLNKYKSSAAKDKDNPGFWGDKVRRSGYRSWTWTFKNQSITLAEFHEEKRENFIKDARMRSPENRYGVKYTKYFKSIVITYNDTYQCEKVMEYEKELAAEELKRRFAQKDEEEESIAKQKERAVNQDI
jgi:hypothetical protein